MIYLRRTNICVNHIFAFIAGFVLDLLIGDPHLYRIRSGLSAHSFLFLIRGLIVMPDIIALKKN